MKVDVMNAVKRRSFVFPLACAAVLAMVLISESADWRSVGMLDNLANMGRARASTQSLAQAVLDAETGQRGYLLTERPEYLEPYRAALSSIEQSLRFLDGYYGNDSDSKGLLTELHALTDSKLSELALTLHLFEQGKSEASRELMRSGIGKEKMEALRDVANRMVVNESARVAQGRGAVYNTLLVSRIGVAALSAISLLALFLYLRQSSALVQQQFELKRAVQVERDRLEAQVINRTAQLTELAQHLQTAREDERSRLARDLHDELGALLTSAKLDAARIKSRLAGGSPEALERLAHLVETLNSGISLKRRIIEDLRPSALSNLGLVATLEILTREFADRSGIAVHTELEPVHLEPTAELVVYRMVQEAITNISKYARATNVWVTMAAHGNQVDVAVRDDGAGFDTQSSSGSAHGLVGMRFRVEAQGGILTLVSKPGQGTLLQARLPQTFAHGVTEAFADAI